MSPEGRLFFPKDLLGSYAFTDGILEVTVKNRTLNARTIRLSPNDVRVETMVHDE
jgi:hypothetical protein